MYNVFPQIRSFSEIVVHPVKTLVLMDIDKTVLKYNKDFNYFYEETRKIFNDDTTLVQTIRDDANEMWRLYSIIQYHDISHTDEEGFRGFIDRLTASSEMMYLTARTASMDDITKQQFDLLGISDIERVVHYTNNKLTKGEYIDKFINLSGYEDIIFVDDNTLELWTVWCQYPNIRCYQFMSE